MMAGQQLKSLQIGRGLAALAVSAFHLSVLLGEYGEPVFSDWTNRGFLGVDFFFVLSGFIILHAHFRDIGQPAAWAAYVYKRFIRVYPIYWIYTAVLVAGLLAGLGETELPRRLGDWLTSLSLVRFTGVTTPLPPAWTLFFEVLFYAVFSIMILNRRAGLALLAVWMAGSVVLGGYVEQSLLGVLFGWFNLNFAIGMAAYLAAPRLGTRGSVVVGLLGICLFAATYAVNPDTHGAGRLFYALAFGLMVAAAAGYERGRVVNLPILCLLGDASYTIYLTHGLMQSTALKIMNRFVTLPGPLTYVVIFVAAAAGGVVLYLMIEKPLLRRLRPKRAPELGATAASAAA